MLLLSRYLAVEFLSSSFFSCDCSWCKNCCCYGRCGIRVVFLFSHICFLVFVPVVVLYLPFRLPSHLDEWEIGSRSHPSSCPDMVVPSSLALMSPLLSKLLLRETTMSQVLLGILKSLRCSQSGFPSAFLVVSWSFLVFTAQRELPSSES